MNAAFSSEECELFAQALAQAWRHLLESGQSRDEALEKAALSRTILKLAGLGERSQAVLVAYALAHVEQSKREIQQKPDVQGGGESVELRRL
jgi:hypothetical protein